QRRDFVRIPVSLSLEYRVENGAKSEETFHTGVIRDLSGGGAQLASKRKLVKGTILQVKFSLPEDLIVCKAKVMWVYTEVKEQKETYLIGLKFIDINERLRERIIRYVFKRQRELIQKGVL
ncbi:MAG: flagellar brake protein, partial [Peptococcales bacterium]